MIKEKVAELLWYVDIFHKQDCVQLAKEIDTIYAERERKMREALEWKCKRCSDYPSRFTSTSCDGCPVEEALKEE